MTRPHHVETLIETDGPELVVAEGDGRAWLGLLSALTAGAERWLYAPITAADREALLSGAVPIEALYRRAGVLDVVASRDGPPTVTVVDGAALPERALPRAGWCLPEWARRAA